MKNVSKFAILGLCLTAILGSGCGKEADNKIKVGYLPMVSSLTHFVAVEQGFYQDEGIEVDANPIETSNLIAQHLVAGEIDAAIELSLVPLLQELEKHPDAAKIFSISSINSKNGFDGIIVGANSSLSRLEDLAGKKVGVFPGSTAKNTLQTVFKEQFPNLELPQCIELSPSLHLQALEAGDIDALFTYEPYLTTGIYDYGFEPIATSIYALQYSPNPIGVAAVNRNWLEANPRLAESFFRAIDNAVLFIEQNPVAARKILAEAIQLNPEMTANMNIMPMSLSTDIHIRNLAGYLAVLKNIGEINVKPNAADICIAQQQ